jgi:phosphopantetheine adenylyltransferase
MSSLGKFLADSLLEIEEQKKTVAIYGGGFKPPHKGHFEVVEKALEKYPQIDEFIIYVGSGTRDGIAQAESLLVWDIYKKYLPLKVKVEPTNSPITAIYDYIKNHQDENVIWVIGAREGKDDDFVDMASRTKGVGKYENVELAPIVTQLDTSGTDARQALKKGQEAFLPFIPEKVKEKTEVFNTLSTVVQEIVTNTEIICDNCGWDWKIADGGKDLYVCHKCGHDNNPVLNESLKGNNDLEKYIPELTKYMVNQGMNIKPLPVVKFITNDKKNAENIFGKTAYYNPGEKSITLFTMNRHPKDVLRSFAHEMIHHEQNLDNRLNNIGTTNTNEDGDLPEIEREAYEKGNMMFRNWEDSIKEGSLVSSTPAPTPKGQFLQNSDVKIKNV